MPFKLRHCRFCHRQDSASLMVKYGTRHYAHPSCYEASGRYVISLSPFVRDHFHETLDAERRARLFAAMARAEDGE
jgi:hypothetical protein